MRSIPSKKRTLTPRFSSNYQLVSAHAQYTTCRRLEAEDQLRQRQAELAMQRRAEQAAEKAAVLNSRIARGARVRRARQLRTERIAAKKADERDAVAEAAKRCGLSDVVLYLHYSDLRNTAI